MNSKVKTDDGNPCLRPHEVSPLCFINMGTTQVPWAAGHRSTVTDIIHDKLGLLHHVSVSLRANVKRNELTSRGDDVRKYGKFIVDEHDRNDLTPQAFSTSLFRCLATTRNGITYGCTKWVLDEPCF